jgi:isoleucyl-tRNA synthetase
VALEDLRISRGASGTEFERSSESKVFDVDTVPGTSLFRVLSWHEHEGLKKEKKRYGRHEKQSDSPWPVLDHFETSSCIDHALETAWIPVGALRENVQRVIEVARKEKKAVGNSLDAAVELVGDWRRDPEAKVALEAFGDLAEIFVVSQVRFVQQDVAEECFAEETGVLVDYASGACAPLEITVRVVRPRGSKCPRCWNFREDIVEGSSVCARCHEATR